MKKILTLLLLAFFGSLNAYAVKIPKTQGFDKRIVSINFNEKDVTTIYARNGNSTVLKFEDNERILDMSSGFNDGWDFQDRRNFIFIKPIAYVSKIATNEDGETVNKTVIIEPNKKGWNTNFTVLTNKREYLFDLILANNSVHFKVSFNYPKVKRDNSKKALLEKSLKKENDFIKTELQRTTIPRNWDYVMNVNPKSEDIIPDFAYDDGLFTYLGFDNTKVIPSVFLYEETNDENKESIVNTHMKKDGKYDVLVIQKTSKFFILRSGEKIIGISNQGFRINPLQKPNNTISPNVKREVLNGN